MMRMMLMLIMIMMNVVSIFKLDTHIEDTVYSSIQSTLVELTHITVHSLVQSVVQEFL